MKIYILITLLFLFFSTYSTTAQSDFQKIIESEIVKDKLTFQIIGDNLNISIDGKEAKEIGEELSLQGKSGQIVFNTKFIHPLKYQITLKNKALDDELTKAAQEYFSQFQNYISSITNSVSSNAAASGLAVMSSAKSVTIKNPHLIELFAFLNGSYSNFFDSSATPDRQSFLCAMTKINDKEIEKKIIANYEQIFENIWKINSYVEIKSAIEENISVLKEIEGSLKEIKTTNDKLRLEADSFAKVFIKDSSTTVDKNTIGLISNKIGEVENDNKNFLKKKAELDSKYEAFIKLFGDISKNTYGEKDKETRIDEIAFEKGKRNEVTIFFKIFNYDKKSKVIKEKEQKTYIIHLRRYQTFVPVVASGVLYTNLSFQIFGTETNEDGETLVALGESKDNEIAVGAYLNMYLNNGWNNPMFLQLGVGPSKEKPLLFTGLGMSIGSRISISGGAVFTWVPTLDMLNIGDAVTGTTQIENDIKYKFTDAPKFYLGISFDLTN